MRTIVDIPKEDVRRLDQLARRRRVSRAQIVREAVKFYSIQQSPDPLDAAFGIWKDRKDIGDGLAYQNRLRDEWEDRFAEIHKARH